jgi:hypothetical protein
MCQAWYLVAEHDHMIAAPKTQRFMADAHEGAWCSAMPVDHSPKHHCAR